MSAVERGSIGGVVRELLAVAVDPLVEVALPVEQPDRDERQPQVARGLAVVAREHAEAARIDREALVQTELGAEIRDEVVPSEVVELRGARRAQIRVERDDQLLVLGEIGAVGGRAIEDPLIDAAQEQLRVALDLAPEHGIELAEQLSGLGIPAEPEVLGKIREPAQRLRDRGRDLQRERRIRHG